MCIFSAVILIYSPMSNFSLEILIKLQLKCHKNNHTNGKITTNQWLLEIILNININHKKKCIGIFNLYIYLCVGTEAPVSAVRIILSLKALFVPGLSTNQPEKVSELGFVDRFSQAP